MAPPPAAVVLALAMAALAALVLAARPGSRTHRAMAALILLAGASSLAFAAAREAPDAGAAVLYARLAVWYALPLLALVLLVPRALFVDRASVALRAALLAAAGAVVAVGAVFALAPELLVDGAARSGAFWTYRTGPVLYFFNAAGFLAEGVAVALAARAAVSPARGAVERRQAALVGLAFAFLVVGSGAAFLALLVDRALHPERFVWEFGVPAAGAIAGLALALRAAPRLLSAFDGRARAVAAAALALALLSGLADGALAPLALRGASPLPWYDNAVLLRRAAFAAALALALVRYGLAGFGERARRRLATAALVALVSTVALAAAGAALAVAGVTTAGLVLAPAVALATALLSPAPLRPTARRLARRLLVDPDDPAAAGERARRYAAALEAGLPEERLVALREELDLTEREHALVAFALRVGRGGDAPPLLGRYRVERELARGATGAALVALDPATGRRVVLKRFHAPGAAARVAREARALQAVRHPRVVRLLDVERVGKETFLVLAYAEGGSARGLLDRDGPLPPARAVAVALDLLEGLAALHRAGLVHGDVKPENVLLDADGRALLGDFGSARFHGVDATLTGGAVEGSLATVAPEILRGHAPTAAADVYGAGATLYRLLAGEHYVPLDGVDALAARDRVLRAPPRLPHPSVPAALEPVLARALAKRPADRYGSAEEMRAALAAAERAVATRAAR